MNNSATNSGRLSIARNLGTIRASLDGQISQQTIAPLKEALLKIDSEYGQEKTIKLYAKMTTALAKYVASGKAKSVTQASKLLTSLLTELETILKDGTLTDREKKKRLRRDIRKFKRFKEKISSKPAHKPAGIEDLKAALFSLDWEISDRTIQSFETAIRELKPKWASRKAHYNLIKIIHNVIKYIGVKKSQTDAESIAFLYSVYNSLEFLINNPDIPSAERRQLLQENVSRFYDFKNRVSKNLVKKGENSETAVAVPPKKKETGKKSREKRMHISTELAPALSHILTGQGKPGTEDTDLTPLPMDFGDTAPEKKRAGKTRDSGSGRGKGEETLVAASDRDLMEDILSAKDSPVDDLLDEIHQQAIRQDFEEDTDLPPGMKQFVPERADAEPMPEVGDLLDQFFGESDEGKKESARESETAYETREADLETREADLETHDAEAPKEEIVPFEDENILIKKDTEERELSEKEILEQLKSSVENARTRIDKPTLETIEEKISQLETLWQDDSDRMELLGMLHTLNELVQNAVGPPGGSGEKEGALPLQEKKSPKGWMTRIKKLLNVGADAR